MRRALLCSLFVMTAGLPFATATGPAFADPSVTARLGSTTATLLADGAGVQVSIVYSCSKSSTSTYLYSRVTERIREGRVAQGSGSSDALKCNGAKHTSRLVLPSENGYAFKEGVSLAQGTLTACDAVPACTTVSFFGTINVG